MPLLLSHGYPFFLKQTKNILAVQSILLYHHTHTYKNHQILVREYVRQVLTVYTYELTNRKRCTVFLKEVLIPDCFYSSICIPEIIYFGEKSGFDQVDHKDLLLPVLRHRNMNILLDKRQKKS